MTRTDSFSYGFTFKYWPSAMVGKALLKAQFTRASETELCHKTVTHLSPSMPSHANTSVLKCFSPFSPNCLNSCFTLQHSRSLQLTHCLIDLYCADFIFRQFTQKGKQASKIQNISNLPYKEQLSPAKKEKHDEIYHRIYSFLVTMNVFKVAEKHR